MCVLCQASGHARVDHLDTATGQAGQHGSATLSQAIDSLQTSWTHEANPSPIMWGGRTIGYDILDSPAGGMEAAGFNRLSAVKADAARDAFELWDDLVAVDIAERDGAAITVGESATTSGGGTYASYSFYYDGIRGGVDRFKDVEIWFNSGWSTHNEDADMVLGSYGKLTYMHEVGHALGLSHPGTYNAGQAGPISYGNSAEFAEDTRQFTVMSYFNAGSGGGADHTGPDGQLVFAQTPMLLDVAAIQDLYGADLTTRAGDTTYGFNASGLGGHDAVFDFALNDTPVLTIWDGAGTDMLDASGFADNTLIDLRAGAWSSLAGMKQNVAIAFGATIENARGGTGDELIVGNAADNALFGNAGADALHGQAGHDTLFGGRGEHGDTLDGGEGDDVLFAGGGDDMLYGGAGDDFLGGGTGSDAIWAEDGDDTLFGGGTPGHDRLDAGAGDDQVWAGGGDDALFGRAGDDLLGTGSGDDRAEGGTGADTLYGGAGNDTLDAGRGADIVWGGTGDDVIDLGGSDGAADTFGFAAGHGQDTVHGFEAGVDTLDLSGLGQTLASVWGAMRTVAEGLQLDFGQDGVLLTGVTALTEDDVLV